MCFCLIMLQYVVNLTFVWLKKYGAKIYYVVIYN